jgi:hypothetical protein
VNRIIEEIEAEIRRLQAVKALLDGRPFAQSGQAQGEGGEVMDDWDHLDELDDPSTWFFGATENGSPGRAVACR